MGVGVEGRGGMWLGIKLDLQHIGYVGAHMSMHSRVCVCMSVCVWASVCVWVCMHRYVYECVCVRECVHKCVCVWMCINRVATEAR